MLNRVLIFILFLFAKVILAQNHQRHSVEKGETIILIAQKYNVTPYSIYQLNPDAQNGLKPNSVLLIPNLSEALQKKSVEPELVSNTKQVDKRLTYNSLTPQSNERKKMVLLLPFNITKIEGDTLNSIPTRLKKDKFLNMTLDFYAGALMAIDSARTIGIPVDVSIFDSQETKNSSNISTINLQNSLENANAIIGPFYQNNVEKTAALLVDKNVPVISPLSKESGHSFSNMYQTIPSTDVLKKTLFDFMIAKNGNIIAVIDKKKVSASQFLQQNYPQVQIVPLLENGNLLAENLKKLFVKDKMNYVVLATENTGMIKTTMAAMMSAITTHNLQLVIMESNETLDTDEINFEILTKLKLMFPSITRENSSVEAQIFKKEFRKKNKINPNTYATRGFDLTFDTLMRLSQDANYEETIITTATQQVDNKFEFYKKSNSGYTNEGVYILYYDTDLTLKEAK